MLLFKLTDAVLYKSFIEVSPAKISITIGALDADGAAFNTDECHI